MYLCPSFVFTTTENNLFASFLQRQHLGSFMALSPPSGLALIHPGAGGPCCPKMWVKPLDERNARKKSFQRKSLSLASFAR